MASTSTSTRRHASSRPLSRSMCASPVVQTPASTPTPRSLSRSTTSSAPSSPRFTEAKSGSTDQRSSMERRRRTSGSIQAAVVTPIGIPGHSARTVCRTSLTSASASDSDPSARLGCTWRQAAPARFSTTASRAICSGVTGSDGCSPEVPGTIHAGLDQHAVRQMLKVGTGKNVWRLPLPVSVGLGVGESVGDGVGDGVGDALGEGVGVDDGVAEGALVGVEAGAV